MARDQSILIASGDAATRDTLRAQLSRDLAFTVAEAGSLAAAVACLSAADADFAAVILDDGLIGADGPPFHAAGFAGPIIVLGLAGAAAGEDTALRIARPFRLSDLMLRLRAALAAAPPVPVRIGPYRFHPEDKLLRLDGDRRIRLTEKETAILSFLHRMADRAVPRDELLREVWSYNPGVTTHTLETHIYRLRRKIEPDPAQARLLLTEPGGYRLACG